ncbi:MAG TPA: ribosome recycling factor [Candidatus Saccharimonadales bacterium]|nr:ribosome recycling factor [Candidatus Saccharimonadales bacterium]
MDANNLKSKLAKSLDHLKSELSQIRTGRATPSLLENIVVDAYGAKMTLKEVGSITLLDPQNLVVAPWDKSLLKAIGTAILESDLKVNPVVDSTQVRVPIPALTEERRKEFVKVVSVKIEECKNSMRNVRQEVMKEIDKDFSDKKIGEDDKFSQKEQVEDVVKDFVSQADTLGEAKKTDLMSV